MTKERGGRTTDHQLIGIVAYTFLACPNQPLVLSAHLN